MVSLLVPVVLNCFLGCWFNLLMCQKTLFSYYTEELRYLSRDQVNSGGDTEKQWKHMAENRVCQWLLVTSADLIW